MVVKKWYLFTRRKVAIPLVGAQIGEGLVLGTGAV